MSGQWPESVCLLHRDKSDPTLSHLRSNSLQSSSSSTSPGAQLDVLSGGQGGCCSLKLLRAISLPSWLIYSPPSSTLRRPTSNKHPPSNRHRHFFLCAQTRSFSLPSLYLSLSLSFSLAGCEDASSTLQWRQIRPSRPCHRKTSPRKVATFSPFQLICRHSESGEEEGSPCGSITTSRTLSQEKNQEIIWMGEREFS